MTRETKIGLLIGLAIIVLVAVIVSDYVAVQHRDDSADLLNDPAVQSTDPVNVDPQVAERRPADDTTLAFRPDRRDTRTPADNRRQAIPTPEEIDRALAAADASANTARPDIIEQPEPTILDLAAADRFTERVFPPALLAREDRTIPTPEEIETNKPTGRELPGATARIAPVVVNDTPAPQRPTLVHRVEAGDTLYVIAQRYLGNGDLWPRIAQLNPDAVSAEGHVVEGARLLIPHRQGNTDLAPVQADRDRPDRSAQPRTVTVREGDSLAKLARRHLGSADRWPDLLRANRDTIDSPDTIRVGQRLLLPAANDDTQADWERTSGGDRSDRPAAPVTRAENSTTPFNGRRTYTVREGDTLASIAAATLGSRDRWQDLYEANRSRLASPDLVRPGQTLNLPR